MAVARNATKETSRCSSVTRVQLFAKGTASRKANSTCTPGSTRAVIEQLDQLAVEIVG